MMTTGSVGHLKACDKEVTKAEEKGRKLGRYASTNNRFWAQAETKFMLPQDDDNFDVWNMD